MDMQTVIRELQETLIVVTAIQERQAQVLKGHSEWLEQHEKSMTDHRKRMEHVEMNLSEATDKLNGLISFVDDWVRRPKTGDTQ